MDANFLLLVTRRAETGHHRVSLVARTQSLPRTIFGLRRRLATSSHHALLGQGSDRIIGTSTWTASILSGSSERQRQPAAWLPAFRSAPLYSLRTGRQVGKLLTAASESIEDRS
ncbi:hypothetical protein CF326_g5519 [Tilletia indica]|nr:hypothetical protein CF326_g5519 [Tilletia indica]